MDKILIVKGPGNGRYVALGQGDGRWYCAVDLPGGSDGWATLSEAILESQGYGWMSPQAAFGTIPPDWRAVRKLRVLHKIEEGIYAYHVTLSAGTIQEQLAAQKAENIRLQGLLLEAKTTAQNQAIQHGEVLATLKETAANRDFWRRVAEMADRKRLDAETAMNAEKKRAHDLANRVQALMFKAEKREAPGPQPPLMRHRELPREVPTARSYANLPLIPPAPVGALYANGKPRNPGTAHPG